MKLTITLFVVLLLLFGAFAMMAGADTYNMIDIDTDTDYEWAIYKEPTYLCAIHGEQTLILNIGVFEEDLNGNYCLSCVAEWLKDTFPQVEEIYEEAD